MVIKCCFSFFITAMTASLCLSAPGDNTLLYSKGFDQTGTLGGAASAWGSFVLSGSPSSSKEDGYCIVKFKGNPKSSVFQLKYIGDGVVLDDSMLIKKNRSVWAYEFSDIGSTSPKGVVAFATVPLKPGNTYYPVFYKNRVSFTPGGSVVNTGFTRFLSSGFRKKE